MSEPTWTSELPTEPGWYWFRDEGGAKGITRVLRYGDLRMEAAGIRLDGIYWRGARWCGPLVEPPDPAIASEAPDLRLRAAALLELRARAAKRDRSANPEE
jgi:hypothetical protein